MKKLIKLTLFSMISIATTSVFAEATESFIGGKMEVSNIEPNKPFNKKFVYKGITSKAMIAYCKADLKDGDGAVAVTLAGVTSSSDVIYPQKAIFLKAIASSEEKGKSTYYLGGGWTAPDDHPSSKITITCQWK